MLLLFLALLPQFTDPDGSWPVAVQSIALGLIHVSSCAVTYFAVAIGARSALETRPGAAAVVTRVSGGAMVIIDAGLVVDRLVH